MTTVYETHSPEETFAVAKALSDQAAPGDIICLNGELGVGNLLQILSLYHWADVYFRTGGHVA